MWKQLTPEIIERAKQSLASRYEEVVGRHAEEMQDLQERHAKELEQLNTRRAEVEMLDGLIEKFTNEFKTEAEPEPPLAGESEVVAFRQWGS